MSAVTRLVLVVCSCALAPAFAGGSGAFSPETDQQVSPPAAAPAGAESATATKTVAQPNRVVVVDNAVTEDQLKQILAKGYKPQPGPNNEAVYCRKEAQLGTRFNTKVCKSSQRILQEEVQGKDVTRQVQRDNGNPRGH